MPRFVIERDIPEIGSAEREALREAAAQSNGVLAAMQGENKQIQWEHSYVVENKTFCIYLADSEALIHEHADRSGFPATKVAEVRKMIDPVTACQGRLLPPRKKSWIDACLPRMRCPTRVVSRR